MSGYWRRRSAEVIKPIVEAFGHLTRPELKKLIREAYPFWERKYHPYKIWCDEVLRQLGEKPPLGTVVNGAIAAKQAQAENPKQEKLL